MCPLGGDGGERGIVSGLSLRAHAKENLESDGEALFVGCCQDDVGCLLHLCADLAGRHDTEHCRGVAV